jgi:hypothetical protein
MPRRAPTSTVLSAPLPAFLRILANAIAAYVPVVAIAVASLAHAEPSSPPAGTTTVEHPQKPEKKTKATPARAAKGNSTTTKAKASVRATKPAKTPPMPAAASESKDKAAASAKPSQVMDFDTDQVEGQRLEPGFELIESAPRKARHGSLVEPLKPSDSVVNR